MTAICSSKREISDPIPFGQATPTSAPARRQLTCHAAASSRSPPYCSRTPEAAAAAKVIDGRAGQDGGSAAPGVREQYGALRDDAAAWQVS